MANTAQARKRAKQSEKHRLHNASLRSRMRSAIKVVLAAVQSGDKKTAVEAYSKAQPLIDSMVNKKLLKQNTAARTKSRLNAQVKSA